jgi:competence protein ComEC
MMKFLKFVPIQITFFLIIGVLIGNYFVINVIQFTIVSCVVVLFLGIAYFFANKHLNYFNSLFTIFGFSAALLIGVASITFQNQLNNVNHYSNAKNFKIDVPIESVLKIRKVLKPSANYNKYEALILETNQQKTIGKLLVNIKKDSLKNQLFVDDELLVKTEFRAIPKLLNPYGFNYEKYLKNQQIYHQMYVNSTSYLELTNNSKTIFGIAANIRNAINSSLIKNGFKDNELALINALLLGQRQTISEDLLDSYKDAGAIHILAVSGLHIGVILLLLLFLFKSLHQFKNGKLIATVLIISLLWFYAIIAGLSASVVRAVAMFTALSIGLHLNKPSNIYNNLVISMFFLLLFHPFYLFEVGFQLSYLAVFSIVWVQPKLYDLWISEIWFFRKMWQLFTVSIAAQLGILTLSLFYFHQFPGLFFVANMLIIPFLGFILIAGIVVIILSVSNLLPQFVGYLYELVLSFMNELITWVSSFDTFVIRNISMSFLLMISVYLFFILMLKFIEKKSFLRVILVLSSVVFLQSVLFFEKYQIQSQQEFIVFNSRESIIGIRNGDYLELTSKLNSITKSYLIGTGIRNYQKLNSGTKLFHFKNETILVVDSLGLYNFKSLKPTIVVLQNSPKINVARLIKIVQPKIIVSDGTNYKNAALSFEQACLKNKTPFHSTLQKGAFIVK